MIELISVLIGLLASIGGAAGSLRFVREGERAILLRFDKAIVKDGEYQVIMPGLRLMIPSVHKLARIHVRQRTINFPDQAIILADHTLFNVSAVLICRVKDSAQDLYNALFETTNINNALTDYGMVVIREVLGGKNYQDLFGENRLRIAEELIKGIQLQADQWGIEVLLFELSDCRPTDETARMIQASALAAFRARALHQAAQELGVDSVLGLDGNLAAVLIGAPLVATTHVTNTTLKSGGDDSAEEED